MIEVTEIRENLICDLLEAARTELDRDPVFQIKQKKYESRYNKFCELIENDKKLKNIYNELQWLEGILAERMERQMYEKGLLMGNQIEVLIKQAMENALGKVEPVNDD